METLEGRICSTGYAVAKALVTDSGERPVTDEPYILVTRYASPDMAIPAFGAAGIITEEGGVMSHLAVISRELGIPCIGGCSGATIHFESNMQVELDATNKLGQAGSARYSP